MPATALFLVLAGWLAIGLVLSIVLGRRGHDRFSWFVLGTLLGPLAVAFAAVAWHQSEQLQQKTIVASPVTPGEATVDVLVGFDDSPESRAAIASVIGLFGVRLGRLTLATVIPFDGGRLDEQKARAGLEQEAQRLAWRAPGLEIIRGEPATALVTAAAQGGFDLLAVGTTGAGRSHLFGRAARRLAGHSKVPVLVTGQAPEAT